MNQSVLLEWSSYIASATKGLPGDATGHPEIKRDMPSKKDNGKLGFYFVS
jgi:hypothetical protein